MCRGPTSTDAGNPEELSAHPWSSRLPLTETLSLIRPVPYGNSRNPACQLPVMEQVYLAPPTEPGGGSACHACRAAPKQTIIELPVAKPCNPWCRLHRAKYMGAAAHMLARLNTQGCQDVIRMHKGTVYRYWLQRDTNTSSYLKIP